MLNPIECAVICWVSRFFLFVILLPLSLFSLNFIYFLRKKNKTQTIIILNRVITEPQRRIMILFPFPLFPQQQQKQRATSSTTTTNRAEIWNWKLIEKKLSNINNPLIMQRKWISRWKREEEIVRREEKKIHWPCSDSEDDLFVSVIFHSLFVLVIVIAVVVEFFFFLFLFVKLSSYSLCVSYKFIYLN